MIGNEIFYLSFIMKTLLITSAIVVSSFAIVGCSPAGKQAEYKDSKVVTSVEKPQPGKAHYKAYAPENIPAGKPYVVFFHAEWCGTCVKWEKKVLAEDWDENVVILKADYDTNKEFATSLGVSKQSTAVFFDADGNVVEVEKDPRMDTVEDFFEGDDDDADEYEDSDDEVESTTEEGVVVSPEVAAVIPTLGDVSVNAVVVDDAETVEAVADTPAVFTAYSAEAVPAGEKYAVYFHASWCPSCVSMEKKIHAALGELPAGAVILKADYDTETALKAQYGVTSQHTLVTVNADGSVAGVKKGGSVADIKAFLN